MCLLTFCIKLTIKTNINIPRCKTTYLNLENSNISTRYPKNNEPKLDNFHIDKFIERKAVSKIDIPKGYMNSIGTKKK